MNGILLLLIVLNMICIGVGAYKPVLRFIGAWTASVLCLAHFIIIIISFAIRFSDSG